MPVRAFTDIFAPPVAPAQAKDIHPRFGVEASDSGAAAAAGLTYYDPASGLPAASENDVIRNVGSASVVIGGITLASGASLRAVRDTVPGVAANWTPWGGAGTSDSRLWAKETDYKAGDERIAQEPAAGPSYGIRFWWKRKTDGQSGGAFNLTERADWDRGQPAFFVPETKDTAPTAGSTAAVESQGVKAADDAQTTAITAEVTRATAAEVAEAARATGEETRIQTELDAQELKQHTHETNAQAHLPVASAPLEFVRRNAADDGWETSPITISSSNTVSGFGAPGGANPATVAVTQAGYYYQQIDAALGANDVWGPSVAGAPATWPAQADGKSADPEVGSPTDFGDAIEGAKPKSWSADVLDARIGGAGGIATVADQPTLTAIAQGLLNDGDARSHQRTIWVWHASMIPEQADGLPTLEPDDKANPGVDEGYWVQQVPEMSSSFGDFRTSRTTIHTFGDSSSIERVRFIASDQNYATRKSLLQELEFAHFTQGGNGWAQVNGGATDGDGFVSIEKQFELSAGRHYRVEIFTRFNPDDATAIDWRVESQYSYNVDVVNNVRNHDRLTIVDFEIIRSSAADTSAKNALVYPVGDFTALAVNDSGAGADGAVYKLPTVDALQITLPAKADMNAAEGIWRVRISGDWDALSTQTTVLSFTDDTANGVDMGTGLPDDGNEWLDLVFDAANDKWIATSGGDVTLALGAPPATLVERVVAIKDPGFGTILGDFNFMMSGGGVRSIQIRTVSGTIAYTDFNTYWSAGAGGDNDAPLAGNWDETWRYAADANMTAHNHYQHVEFIANGWFYHVHIVVGPGFNDNRLTLTRWRVA